MYIMMLCNPQAIACLAYPIATPLPVMMTSLPDALNHFYSQFEMQNDTPAQKLPTPPNDQALCLSPADVRMTLSRINPCKAVGPDNIPGHVLNS